MSGDRVHRLAAQSPSGSSVRIVRPDLPLVDTPIMETMCPLRVAVAVACAVTASVSLAAGHAAGAPQPLGQPPLRPPATAPGQAPPAPRPPAPPTAAPAPQAPPAPGARATAAPVPAAEPAPTAQTLGLPVYPAAQYLATYDAGRGQKYVLFGTTAAFADVVGYYRTQLSDKGDLVYKEPLTHVFEVGRFREETMAFPPGVTVKDWTYGGSQGYPHLQANAQTVRYPTVIMLVPQPPPPQTPRK